MSSTFLNYGTMAELEADHFPLRLFDAHVIGSCTLSPALGRFASFSLGRSNSPGHH